MATVENIEALAHVDCECGTCRGACSLKPGWFLPGEAEKVAEHLGMTLEELFKTKLAVDWFDDPLEIDYNSKGFVLSPAVLHNTPGEEFPGDPKGACVFYLEGKCSIHSVKPFECRSYIHSESNDAINERHRKVAVKWLDHKPQIEELLGRHPVAAEYGGFGSFFNMFD